jgi:hypothetical protein
MYINQHQALKNYVMKGKSLFIVMILAGLMVTSCQKSEPLEEASLEAADDAVLSEALFDDAFASLEIASIMAEYINKSATIIDTCPLVTFTSPGPDFWPRNVVIDYGEACTGLNDIVRSGQIIFTISGPRGATGSQRTLTFDNYYVNGAKVEGTKTVTNLGPNANENMVFSVVLSGGKITFPDEKTIALDFDREREYIAGYDTWWNLWDDICLITGTATGTNLDGLSYTHTIINALEWQAACRFLVSGTIRFDIEGIEPFVLDYGDGDCDANATLSRGDETREITLRYWHPKYPIGK